MGKRIRITRNGNVLCPMTSQLRPLKDCVVCEDCFGYEPYQFVNCKRGGAGWKVQPWINKRRKKEDEEK